MRWIPDEIDRARLRATLTVRVVPRLSLGVEVNPYADEVGPLVNLVAVTETRTRPALMFGTSSDRIGTPEGRAYFATLSKNLREVAGVALAPYVGASYGTYDDELRAIGGLWVGLGGGFSSTLIWDGVDLHPTVDYRRGRHTVTALWVALERAGIAYSVSF